MYSPPNNSGNYVLAITQFILVVLCVFAFSSNEKINSILLPSSGADPGFYFLARGLGTAYVPHGSRAAPDGGTGGEKAPLKLLRVRKYRTSFLNRNWLKLYHMQHDTSHRRYVQWSMIFCSWRKALLRLQYEEQQSKAFACSRNICVILFNAHYPIPLRSKEKELIRMFEIVLGRGKWTCLKQNGKEQVKNIHNLTPYAWLSEYCDVCFKIDQ